MKWKITTNHEVLVLHGTEWRCVGTLVAQGSTVLFVPAPGYEQFDACCLEPSNKAA